MLRKTVDGLFRYSARMDFFESTRMELLYSATN